MKNKGFTLTEMIVSLGILGIVALGVINGSIQLGKNIARTRKTITAREELSTFCQGVYSFSNRSFGAYFYDETNQCEWNYLNEYADADPSDPIFQTIFFLKDAAGTPENTATMVYSPNEHTISWVRLPGAESQIMLTEVYPIDYENDSNPGEAPIFKFPHRNHLYSDPASPTRAQLVILEFKKKVAEPTSENPEPVTIPVKLYLQLNTMN